MKDFSQREALEQGEDKPKHAFISFNYLVIYMDLMASFIFWWICIMSPHFIVKYIISQK